jgi:hypothetical protein
MGFRDFKGFCRKTKREGTGILRVFLEKHITKSVLPRAMESVTIQRYWD